MFSLIITLVVFQNHKVLRWTSHSDPISSTRHFKTAERWSPTALKWSQKKPIVAYYLVQVAEPKPETCWDRPGPAWPSTGRERTGLPVGRSHSRVNSRNFDRQKCCVKCFLNIPVGRFWTLSVHSDQHREPKELNWVLVILPSEGKLKGLVLFLQVRGKEWMYSSPKMIPLY